MLILSMMYQEISQQIIFLNRTYFFNTKEDLKKDIDKAKEMSREIVCTATPALGMCNVDTCF